jgi:hypothetical protein
MVIPQRFKELIGLRFIFWVTIVSIQVENSLSKIGDTQILIKIYLHQSFFIYAYLAKIDG